MKDKLNTLFKIVLGYLVGGAIAFLIGGDIGVGILYVLAIAVFIGIIAVIIVARTLIGVLCGVTLVVSLAYIVARLFFNTIATNIDIEQSFKIFAIISIFFLLILNMIILILFVPLPEE